MTTVNPATPNPAPEAQLEPCPKCRDTAALCLQMEQVFCGRCAFEAPLETWQARDSADDIDALRQRILELETEIDTKAGYL
jgi:hypothetical protein